MAGVDGAIGQECGAAVGAYKKEMGLSPSDAVAGIGTVSTLDREVAYLEGGLADLTPVEPKILARDPAIAGLWESRGGDPSVADRVLDFLELGDKFCFRLSFIAGGPGAQIVGRLVEGPIFEDFCGKRGGRTPQDFLDAGSSTDYVNFLIAQHPAADPARLRELGARRRPDILSNRAPAEWYEIKPFSIAGGIAAIRKLNSIPGDYAARGLPYLPGTSYVPSDEIPLATLIGDAGEELRIICEARRVAPGLIFWTLCVKGDFVKYFNRVRITAGILAILVALAPEILEAVEAAAVVETVREIAAGLGAVLPLLVPR
jgi:hypothetical protein